MSLDKIQSESLQIQYDAGTYKLDFGSSNDLCISRTMGVKPVPAANMTRF